MNLILRYKNIVISLILIFIFYLIVKEIISHFDAIKLEIKGHSEELEKGGEAINRWKIFQKQYQELKMIFLDEDALVFKRFIEKNAQEAGVRIISFKTSRSEKELYWVLSTHLQIAGNYDNFLTFINAVEHKSIEIEKITINKGQEEKSILVSLDLKGFSLK
ncbi:MAG: hypothetical protein KBB01_02125 [Candidatus Omnitrophica bacterium]|jgi:hypothetical protein|nr:hypothetical protein [Candidatus Omnitrophota bacterium]